MHIFRHYYICTLTAKVTLAATGFVAQLPAKRRNHGVMSSILIESRGYIY